MKLISWCLLIVSAILYAIPLIVPYEAWWMVFLFPIPLFYVATQENLGFKEGFIWGSITIATHLSGVLLGIDNFTDKTDGWARIIPAIVLISYSGFCSAVIFWLCAHAKKIFAITTPAATIMLWTVTLWCYIFFFDRLCLTPFGRIEGYFGLHPIVALAVHPKLLSLLPILGKNFLSWLIYLVPASVTLFLVQRTRLHALLIGISLLPWIISISIPIPQPQKPAWLDSVLAFPALFFTMETPLQQAQAAQEYFNIINAEYPESEIILLPESCFYCDHLSTQPELPGLWSENHLGKPMHIILGSFRWDGPLYRNSLHWIYNGKLQDVFDKRHAMALLERIPTCCDFYLMHELFYKNRPQITPSLSARPIFHITQEMSFMPYICSELFFNEFPDDTHKDTTILATTNDFWCYDLYVSKLMYLNARLKAILWQRNLVYVSFKYAAFFDKYGNEINITKVRKLSSESDLEVAKNSDL